MMLTCSMILHEQHWVVGFKCAGSHVTRYLSSREVACFSIMLLQQAETPGLPSMVVLSMARLGMLPALVVM